MLLYFYITVAKLSLQSFDQEPFVVDGGVSGGGGVTTSETAGV
jgi:hypothetical protein